MRINLKAMQKKVDRLLSVFTTLKEELETQIGVLEDGISENERQIRELGMCNARYGEKIAEYEKLKANIDSFLG